MQISLVHPLMEIIQPHEILCEKKLWPDLQDSESIVRSCFWCMYFDVKNIIMQRLRGASMHPFSLWRGQCCLAIRRIIIHHKHSLTIVFESGGLGHSLFFTQYFAGLYAGRFYSKGAQAKFSRELPREDFVRSCSHGADLLKQKVDVLG